MILLTFKIKNKYLRTQITKYVNKNSHKSDKKIYEAIAKIIGDYNIFESKRGVNKRTMSEKIEDWNNLKPNRYLDVGCFQGDITISVGNHFGLNKNQIHGIDINKYVNTSDFIYTVYNGVCIPYIDASFDLITCFMVMHHVPPKNLVLLLKEIYRVLKPGGLFIIKEHDAAGQDYLLLDVLHEYYDYVLNPTRTWEESAANYRNSKYWTQKITDAGFKQKGSLPLDFGKYGPTDIYKSYVLSYTK
jgi:ubiquinone/menaquinone biosynthesis C-methylase UbiE